MLFTPCLTLFCWLSSRVLKLSTHYIIYLALTVAWKTWGSLFYCTVLAAVRLVLGKFVFFLAHLFC
ncbi:hypothetical protein BC827DRAFT_1186756 [Russula dissimulans]|nr:hypothetical protein BC827DRAFT_1186756 [Russula dissimulans]